jgi:hypothetical protein
LITAHPSRYDSIVMTKSDGRAHRLKPPVRVRPSALLRSRSGYSLGARAVDELYRVAEVLSEGRRDADTFFGTTLVTIDLARALSGVELNDALLSRLREAITGSVRVRLRAMRLAHDDLARRFPDETIGTARTETEVRIEGTTLHVDVDLEAPIERSSKLGTA